MLLALAKSPTKWLLRLSPMQISKRPLATPPSVTAIVTLYSMSPPFANDRFGYYPIERSGGAGGQGVKIAG